MATDSMLQIRDPSPRERLSRTSIKQIPPKPMPPDWNVKRDTEISTVQQQLTDMPERWFVPIVRDDGTLDTVINEEAVWRYLVDLGKKPDQEKVENLLKYIEGKPALKRFKDIHVTVTMETMAGTANDLMDSRHVFLAIVVSERKPTHFFTTSDVRKLLLQDGTAT